MAAGSRRRGSCICRYTLCAVRKRPPSGLQPSVCRWPVTIRHCPSTCTTSSSGVKPWAFIFIWKPFSAWTLSRAAAALSLSSCTGSTATWFCWAWAVLGHRDATWLPLGSPLPTRFIRVSNCHPRARGSECSTWCSCRGGTRKGGTSRTLHGSIPAPRLSLPSAEFGVSYVVLTSTGQVISRPGTLTVAFIMDPAPFSGPSPSPSERPTGYAREVDCVSRGHQPRVEMILSRRRGFYALPSIRSGGKDCLLVRATVV